MTSTWDCIVVGGGAAGLGAALVLGRARRRTLVADGSELPCDGLLVPVTLHQRSDLATRLGAESAPSGPLAADAITVAPRLEANVPGLFAAGDTTTQMPSLANAIATGSFAAAAIVGAGLG